MNMREQFEAWAEKELYALDKQEGSDIYRNVITRNAWLGWNAGLTSQQKDHIGDSTKLVQAVNALAAQTGESPESIIEWLTDKGGLTQLMLSHFSGMQSQAQQQITKDTIQHGTGIGLVVDGKLQHVKPEDFYLSSEDEKNIKMRQQLESLPFAASQAQQPTELSKQLREYAADSGYSHNDYADTMLAAASEIERLTASQAQQPTQEPAAWLAPTEDERRNVITPQHKANLSKKESYDNYEKEYAARFTVPLYLQSQAQQTESKPVMPVGFEHNCDY